MSAEPLDSHFLQLSELARGRAVFEKLTHHARCMMLLIAICATDFSVAAAGVLAA
jgi:hypothetical protein